MTLFKGQTAQEVWIDRWCHTCFQPDEAARRIQGRDTQCPILAAALRTKRKPVQWDRNPRSKDMETAIKCNEYAARPATTIRPKVNEFDVPQESLFNEPAPQPYSLVPVDGWPDRPTKDGVDHA